MAIGRRSRICVRARRGRKAGCGALRLLLPLFLRLDGPRHGIAFGGVNSFELFSGEVGYVRSKDLETPTAKVDKYVLEATDMAENVPLILSMQRESFGGKLCLSFISLELGSPGPIAYGSGLVVWDFRTPDFCRG